MATLPDSFDIAELAAAGGVTTRTVRYYVQQGLLPSSGTRGPGARYDRGHLDRLLLIKRLQAQHLPLAEIRKRIEGMSAHELRQTVERFPAQKKSSAAEYVREALARQGAPLTGHLNAIITPIPASKARLAPLPPPSAGLSQFFGDVQSAPAPASPSGAETPAPPQQPAPSPPPRSTWERVAFAPDVELHLRRPLSREQNRLVERLLDFARHLFSEDA